MYTRSAMKDVCIKRILSCRHFSTCKVTNYLILSSNVVITFDCLPPKGNAIGSISNARWLLISYTFNLAWVYDLSLGIGEANATDTRGPPGRGQAEGRPPTRGCWTLWFLLMTSILVRNLFATNFRSHTKHHSYFQCILCTVYKLLPGTQPGQSLVLRLHYVLRLYMWIVPTYYIDVFFT